MIDHVIFIPGLCGSELFDGPTLIWPGTGWEKIVGTYPDSSVEILANKDNLTVGSILDKVSLFGGKIDHFATGYNVALDLLSTLGFNQDNKTLTPFPYDWRQDIRKTAKLLQTRLAQPDLAQKHIAIVAHSMGGLVARYALENLPKSPNVQLLVLAAVPHHGAPAAFQNLIGARPEVFLSPAQVKQAVSNPQLPAAYQLLPHPATASFQEMTSVGFNVVDVYDANVYLPLGLAGGSMEIAKATWAELQTLSLGWKPPCRYFAIAGCEGHTIVANYVPSNGTGAIAIEPTVAGDGTVPLWSAAPAALPCRFVPCDHLGVFEDGQMRTILQGLLRPQAANHPFALTLGDGRSTAVSAAIQFFKASGLPRLSIQAKDRTVEVAQEVTASLVFLDAPQTVLDGELLIQVVTADGTTDLPSQTISYSGAPIRKLDVVVTPNQAGLMIIDFKGRGWPDDPKRRASVLVLPSHLALGITEAQP